MLTTLLRDSRALATLAVPLIFTQLAQVALTTTDTVMMGLLGTQELAAGGLAIVIFNQIRTMGVGLIASVGNQIAAAAARTEQAAATASKEEEQGEKHEEVRAIVRTSLAVASLAGIVGAVLMILTGQALTYFGQNAAVAERTQNMLLALAPGLLPCLWSQAIRQFTVGMRSPQAFLQITIGSVAINAGLNWALIHGTWELPRLGLAGIGVATSTVYLLSFLALSIVVKKDRKLAPLLSLNVAKADRASMKRLIVLGVPTAATYGSEAAFFFITALMAGSFGTAALAAHTAVNQLVYIVFQVAVGLSHAASINVSRELALGRPDGARHIKNTALACASALNTVVGIVYLVQPHLVLTPFLDPGHNQASAIATELLMATALLQFCDCAQSIGVGLLRGLDDTKGAFRVTLIGYWGVGLPASWLLAYPLDLDTLGIWLGLLAGLATTAILLLRRYRQGLCGRGLVVDVHA